MNYLVKLFKGDREFYVNMPGTVTNDEWQHRLEVAEEKWWAVRWEWGTPSILVWLT